MFGTVVKVSAAYKDDPGLTGFLWEACADAVYSLESHEKQLAFPNQVCPACACTFTTSLSHTHTHTHARTHTHTHTHTHTLDAVLCTVSDVLASRVLRGSPPTTRATAAKMMQSLSRSSCLRR